MKYKQLKIMGEVVTDQDMIERALSDNGFSWIVNCELDNASLEIYSDKKHEDDILVWDGGTFLHGKWIFGVWRRGMWMSGTWENGVFYDGEWLDGVFKSGIIGSLQPPTKPTFSGGIIKTADIKSGEFEGCEVEEGLKEVNESKVDYDYSYATFNGENVFIKDIHNLPDQIAVEYELEDGNISRVLLDDYNELRELFKLTDKTFDRVDKSKPKTKPTPIKKKTYDIIYIVGKTREFVLRNIKSRAEAYKLMNGYYKPMEKYKYGKLIVE